MRAKELVVLLLSLLLVGTGHAERFCGLPEDAVNVTCNPTTYLEAKIQDTLPAIIVSAVIFVFLNVLIFVPCCVSINCCCSELKTETRAYFGHKQIVIPYLVFLLLILGGITCLIYANITTNESLVNFKLVVTNVLKTLTTEVTDLGVIVHNSSQAELLPPVEHNITETLDGLNDATVLLDRGVNTIIFAKDIFTYGTLAFIVLLAGLFLGFVLSGNSATFHLTGCLSWFIVLGVCVVVPLCTFYLFVGADLCYEVRDEPHGLFDIIVDNGNTTYSQYVKDVEALKANSSVTLCREVTRACANVPGAAGICPCDLNNITALATRPVIDGSETTTVGECAQSCTSKELQDLSKAIMDTIDLHALIDSSLVVLHDIWLTLSAGTFEKAVGGVFCLTAGVHVCLWLGMGLIGFSFFISESVLLGMERAICCFKALGDEYYALERIEK